MSKNGIKEFIISLSKNEGFDEIGFAPAEILSNEYHLFSKWVDKSYNADMHYLARKQRKRENISSLLEGAKTIIVFLQNYRTDFGYSNKEKMGKISRYAWGDDYHKIIKKKLISISRKAKELYPNNSFKPYVDTGPILEKQWAVRAGVGWQGKNSLILNRTLGSYCFIGIVITDLSIESDSKMKDYCGSCTACIDSCPTNAIVAPAVVDSNKCISYWTIESDKDKEFPPDIRKNLHGWIFGCDICQEVCPWNRRKKLSDLVHYKPRNGDTELGLTETMNMTEEEFILRFRNSNIKRSKLIGLKRNVRELLKKT